MRMRESRCASKMRTGKKSGTAIRVLIFVIRAPLVACVDIYVGVL